FKLGPSRRVEQEDQTEAEREVEGALLLAREEGVVEPDVEMEAAERQPEQEDQQPPDEVVVLAGLPLHVGEGRAVEQPVDLTLERGPVRDGGLRAVLPHRSAHRASRPHRWSTGPHWTAAAQAVTG